MKTTHCLPIQRPWETLCTWRALVKSGKIALLEFSHGAHTLLDSLLQMAFFNPLLSPAVALHQTKANCQTKNKNRVWRGLSKHGRQSRKRQSNSTLIGMERSSP